MTSETLRKLLVAGAAVAALGVHRQSQARPPVMAGPPRRPPRL